jgi:hypothetical protein
MNITIETSTVKEKAAEDRQALIEIIKTAHQGVGAAARHALQQAFTAGAALLKLKQQVNHGEWGNYLDRHCELNTRTADVYMQLAKHRQLIEANTQHAANLSLRGALKLIPKSPKDPKGADKADQGGASAKSPLSSLAWSEANVDQRRHFVDAVGLISWLAAIPPSWRHELERRIDGRRARAAKSKDINATISKALRQALSHHKNTKNNAASASVAAALNGILNKLKAADLDLNDLEVITPAVAARKRAA